MDDDYEDEFDRLIAAYDAAHDVSGAAIADDASVNSFDALIADAEEFDAEQEQLPPEEEEPHSEDDDDGHIPNPRAMYRYKAGTAVWLANRVMKKSEGRMRSGDYRAKLRANWHANKARYEAQRAARKAQAIADLKAQGFMVKTGRPPLPPGVAAIPKAAIELFWQLPAHAAGHK